MATYFKVGGTLRADTPSYVVRPADTALYNALSHGEFCYVLDTRQAGKSSLLARTADRLFREGFTISNFEMTTVTTDNPTQWYLHILLKIGEQIGMRQELAKFWRENSHFGGLQRWMGALVDVALPHVTKQLIIILDEIDNVRSLPFNPQVTDEFFAGIRSLYNSRAHDPRFERLTFCLAGTATPDELIKDPKTTPFNIGRGIVLSDFTEEEAAPLAKGLQAWTAGDTPRLREAAGSESPCRTTISQDSSRLLSRILYWTGGHPYLTQKLCQSITEEENLPGPQDVDRICSELFFRPGIKITDNNLLNVSNSLLSNKNNKTALLDLYQKVLTRQKVSNDTNSPLVNLLRLSGVVRVQNGLLVIRNRIYGRVFNARWVRRNTSKLGVELQKARGEQQRLQIALRDLEKSEKQAQSALAEASIERDKAHRLAYIANMNLIQKFWEASDIGHLLEVLESTPRSLDSASRNADFEWGYWDRLCHLHLLALKGHRGSLLAVAFSANGQRIATGSSDSLVRVWETRAGRKVFTLAGHTGGVTAVAFSPNGKYLLTAGGDRTARLWEVETRRRLHIWSEHTERVTAVAFSPDGRHLLTGSDDRTARLWETKSGRAVHTLKGRMEGLMAVAFSPDGTRIATGSSDHLVRVWDTITGSRLLTLKGHTDGVTAIAFSPDGTLLLTGSADKTARLWETETGRKKFTLHGHAKSVLAVAFFRQGRHMLTGGKDSIVRVWDTRTGKETREIDGKTDGITAFAFSRDARHVVLGSLDKIARVWDWDVDTRRRDLPLRLKGSKEDVLALAFSPDGKRVAIGSRDTVTRVHQDADANVLEFSGHTQSVLALAFSRDGRRLLTGGADKTARLWDLQAGWETATLQGHTGDVLAVAFSKDGRRLLTGSRDRTARIWETNAQAGRSVLTLRNHEDSVTAVAFSPDGTRIATGSSDHLVRVWDTITGSRLLTLKGHTDGVTAIAFSPDGTLLLTGSADKTARVWEVQKGREILTLKSHTGGVTTAAFSPDGRRVLTGSSDHTVRMWEVLTGRETLTLKGHTHSILTAVFSPDGRRILSGSMDRTIRVWIAKEG